MWLLISVLVVLFVLGILIWTVWKNKQMHKEPDYYTIFIIGLTWTLIGFSQLAYSDIPTFSIIGVVFMAIGLAHKDKWKKQELTPAGKQRAWIALGIGLLVAIALGVAYVL